jgi:hypothetical protein
MEIYCAHPITREYLGQTTADPDPLGEDNWLIPAHAYADAPPAVSAGQTAQRSEDGSAWLLVSDHRGTVYDTRTGAAQQHAELGELPESLTTEPRPSVDHTWSGNAWAFDAALQVANLLTLQASLCQQIDTAADDARRAVAGDALRAVEYDKAAEQAKEFVAVNYQGDVPPMVAAWAINGRTAQQAADDILREAAQYNAALVQLRTVRLSAKEMIRTAMAASQVEQAQDVADETIASIKAAVAGIGNNSGV